MLCKQGNPVAHKRQGTAVGCMHLMSDEVIDLCSEEDEDRAPGARQQTDTGNVLPSSTGARLISAVREQAHLKSTADPAPVSTPERSNADLELPQAHSTGGEPPH